MGCELQEVHYVNWYRDDKIHIIHTYLVRERGATKHTIFIRGARKNAGGVLTKLSLFEKKVGFM